MNDDAQNEATGTGEAQLPLAGRRVAMLVYNDAHADARVLKSAHTLREAGAQVRILAVARTHLGYPATVEELEDGVSLVRVREPGFITYVPRLKRALARAKARLRAARGTRPVEPRASADSTGRGEGAPGAGDTAADHSAVAGIPAVAGIAAVAGNSAVGGEGAVGARAPRGNRNRERARLNRVLVRVLDPVERVARTVNLYVNAGVPLQHLKFVAVAHGAATSIALDEAHYREQYGTANPNLPVIEELRKAGVDIAVCGQAVAEHHYAYEWIDSRVTLALSALTTIMDLQQQGYALTPL